MSLTLTEEELFDLTGRVQPAAQIRWLVREGYRFDRNADGRPKVSRAHYLKRQGVVEKRQEPNWQALG